MPAIDYYITSIERPIKSKKVSNSQEEFDPDKIYFMAIKSGFSVADLDNITLGALMDILLSGQDIGNNVQEATQEDYDNF